MSDVNIYGIPNCDTIKKTINWFDEHQIEFSFHNYKKVGIEKSTLKKWCKLVGWEMLLNKKGTTWKKIQPNFVDVEINESIAIDIMFENNSAIKRPVIEFKNKILVGFDEYELLENFK
ncbi:MAG: Spx/MgsR family RNA polymerase-binding regulatory protein [Sphingobacteriales bacterium]|nr:Spx/MgsR family RNA polymerase-binding regulatory protein [Sphingobacteriales bacterium]